MLSPAAPALDREQAMNLVAQRTPSGASPNSSPSCAAWTTKQKGADRGTVEAWSLMWRPGWPSVTFTQGHVRVRTRCGHDVTDRLPGTRR